MYLRICIKYLLDIDVVEVMNHIHHPLNTVHLYW